MRGLLANAPARTLCLPLLAAALLLSPAGCVKGDTSAAGKLKVACTTTMVGDLVRRIGGDRVDVRVIMGPGVDPHTYKASPNDFAELNAATLVFYNGLHLEGKMVDVFEEQVKGKSTAVSSAVPPEKLLAWQAGEAGAHDPHIWFDVSIWASAVPVVRDRLIAADPAGADAYRANAAATQASLTALDAEVRQKLASVPKGRRVLVTSHDAYGYFGKAYDVEVRGIQGISTETEAGMREMTAAAKFLEDRKIPAVFVESSVSPKTIQSVVASCKGNGHDVRIGGELFSDAMGAPGQHPGYAVETYEGMVRYNVDTIVNALK